MISLRHVGMYVDCLEIMENFYKNALDMSYICKREKQVGIFDAVLNEKDSIVYMTKLITPKGAITHEGDMVELLYVDFPKRIKTNEQHKKIQDAGVVHVAFECKIDTALKAVGKYGGEVIVEPIIMPSGNKMCFVSDPENNIIELIERN